MLASESEVRQIHGSTAQRGTINVGQDAVGGRKATSGYLCMHAKLFGPTTACLQSGHHHQQSSLLINLSWRQHFSSSVVSVHVMEAGQRSSEL